MFSTRAIGNTVDEVRKHHRRRRALRAGGDRTSVGGAPSVESLRLTGICGVIGVSPLGTEFTLDMNSVLFGRTVRGIIRGRQYS